jgi:hypothetical protein
MSTERSSLSGGRFGLAEIFDDELGLCVVQCYRCKTEYIVNREESAIGVADVKNKGVVAFLTVNAIKLEESLLR